LTRNDVIFGKKNITILFTRYFQGNLLDAVLFLTSQFNLKQACEVTSMEIFSKNG